MYNGVMISRELTAASSEPLVLSILSSGESYGYALIRKVRACSGERLHWTDGMLYPVLHRLQSRGFIKSRWGKGEGGPRRRYYRLTAKGKAALEEQREQWTMVNETLVQLWEGKSHA